VWACSNEGREVWCRNLGAKDKVAEVMSQWLGSYVTMVIGSSRQLKRLSCNDFGNTKWGRLLV
jgi:hypothetical protein